MLQLRGIKVTTVSGTPQSGHSNNYDTYLHVRVVLHLVTKVIRLSHSMPLFWATSSFGLLEVADTLEIIEMRFPIRFEDMVSSSDVTVLDEDNWLCGNQSGEIG